MNKIVWMIVLLNLFSTNVARADFFGGDVVVLTQILVEALEQLAQLRQLLNTANDQVDLIRDINQGINDSLNLIHNLNPNLDPGIYRDWDNPNVAMDKLHSIYGDAIPSPDQRVQNDLDEGIAEAVAFHNQYYQYTQKLDEIGEQIKSASHVVSPGGASKLTSEALGILIQLENQHLRAESSALKLHAQALAVENRRRKSETKHFLDAGNQLKQAITNEKLDFSVPRF